MATARLRSASSHCSVGPASSPHAASRVSDLHVPVPIVWRHFSTCKPDSLVKLDNFGSVACLYGQTRWASQAAAVKETEASGSKISIGPKPKHIKEDDKDDALVYQGPISSTIKKAKLLSLSTCCLSVSLGPVITFMTSPEMNVILKGAVASTVIFLSATTTAALHWFVSPYIHKLRWRPGSDSLQAEMMPWLVNYTPEKDCQVLGLRGTSILWMPSTSQTRLCWRGLRLSTLTSLRSRTCDGSLFDDCTCALDTCWAFEFFSVIPPG